MNQEQIKQCFKCKVRKSLNEFARNKRKNDGLSIWCKQCKARWYKDNKTELRQKHQQYRNGHQNEIKQYLKQYHQKHYKELKTKLQAIDLDNITSEERVLLLNYRFRHLTHTTKIRAKRDNLEYNLNLDFVIYLYNQTAGRCPCCKKGFDLSVFHGNGRKPNSPSIDRFESSRGYTKNNVGIICFRCNMIKNEGTLEDHQMIVDWMTSCKQSQNLVSLART